MICRTVRLVLLRPARRKRAGGEQVASGSADATVRLWLVAYDAEASGLQGRCNRSCAAVPSGGAWVVDWWGCPSGGGRRKWLRRALGGTAGALSRAIALRQSVGRVVGPAGGAARGLGVVCIVYRVSLVECGRLQAPTHPPLPAPLPAPPPPLCHLSLRWTTRARGVGACSGAAPRGAGGGGRGPGVSHHQFIIRTSIRTRILFNLSKSIAAKPQCTRTTASKQSGSSHPARPQSPRLRARRHNPPLSHSHAGTMPLTERAAAAPQQVRARAAGN